MPVELAVWYFFGIKWLSRNETPAYNIALTGKSSQHTLACLWFVQDPVRLQVHRLPVLVCYMSTTEV